MILFRNDWKYYPEAVIHETTSNESALILASKLKKMGVLNNSFFLALYDRSLLNVDPYSSNLTIDQMERIGLEIRLNPWYFFREIARAPAISGIDPDMVEFNRGNLSLWWSFFNHITYILIQPRQTGKSFSTDLLMTLLMGFLCNNTNINLLTKDDDLRIKNIERLKNIYSELPDYLKLKTKKDANNTTTITIKSLNNVYNTHVPQASEKAAFKLGRGLTSPIFHIDEAPFQPNISTAMPSALAAMGAAVDKAKKTNEPHGIILTTTAGKIDDSDGFYVYDYASNSSKWTEEYYDAVDTDDLYTKVCKNSREGLFRIYGNFSHIQLGKSDEWLKEKLDNSNSRGLDATRDFFGIWTNGSLSSPIDPDLLKRMNDNVTSPEYSQISHIGGYITRWYIPSDQIEYFMNTRTTAIGIDTSDAIGKDAISFVMIDTETGGLVACGTYNETNTIKFIEWLMSWLIKYDKCTIIIERRSSGVTMLDYLLLYLPPKGIDPFKRLFNWVVNNSSEHKERYAEVKLPMNRRSEDIYDRCKKYFGFATSGGGDTARNILYGNVLQNSMKNSAESISDKELAGQINGLTERNGRIDHPKGGHDDLVIGWLLGQWMITMGMNIQFYGIDPSKVLKDRSSTTNTISHEDVQQSKIRQRIITLSDKLSNETDTFLCERYENELRYLDSKIILTDTEYFSVDAVINKAKEESKRKNNEYGRSNSYDSRRDLDDVIRNSNYINMSTYLP